MVALVLYGAAWLLVRAARPLARARWFPLRHAVLSLGRPGNQTRVILLSVGLGCFFVLGVRSLQQNLCPRRSSTCGRASADLFLIDIQPDQADGIRAMLDARQEGPTPATARPHAACARHGRARPRRQPRRLCGRARPGLARSRVHGDLPSGPSRQNEEVTSGQFWPAQPAGGRGRRTGSVDRAEHSRALRHQRRRRDALRRGGPHLRGQGDERSSCALGGLAERRLHVRLPARRARAGPAHVRRFRAWPGGGRRARTPSVRRRLDAIRT